MEKLTSNILDENSSCNQNLKEKKIKGVVNVNVILWLCRKYNKLSGEL